MLKPAPAARARRDRRILDADALMPPGCSTGQPPGATEDEDNEIGPNRAGWQQAGSQYRRALTVGYCPDQPSCADAANVVECVNSGPSY